MGVLAGWNGKSILDGVVLLQRRRAAEGLFSGWSIAELRLDDDDREALWGWYGRLSRDELNAYLELGGPPAGATMEAEPEEVRRERLFSREEAIGLLLMATLSEQARRAGKLGIIWPAILQLKLQPSARALLFSDNDTPTTALRAALKEAALFFQLRHVFDDDEPRHLWASTLSLQYIFPVQDTKNHLAEWLVGHPQPLALQRVLGGSPRFKAIWGKIAQCRKKKDRDAIRDAIRDCCWFDGHDAHELSMDVLRSVSEPSGAGQTRADTEESEDEEFWGDRLLGEPRLRWAPGQPPQLRAAVLPQPFGASPGSSLKKATLLVDGASPSWLFLRNGQLEPLQPVEMPLPWREEAVATLHDPRQQVVLASQLLRLRQSGVELFELSDGGRRLESMPPGEQAMALWVPAGAQVTPELPAYPVESGSLLTLTTPWPEQIEVREQGVQLWSWRRRSPSPQGRPPVSPARPAGLYVRSSSGEQWLGPQAEAELRSLEQAPVRIVLPPEMATATLAAAGRLAGRIRLRPSPLRGLMGLGEPLVALGQQLEFPLVRTVVDHGVLGPFERDGDRGRLSLVMPLDLDEGYTLLAWPVRGKPVSVNFRAVDGGLEFDGLPAVRALGLAYRGWLLGSWWAESWDRELGSCGLEPRQVLLLLRWLRLPLLQGVDSGLSEGEGSPHARVSAYAREHLDEVLKAWGGVPGLQPELFLENGSMGLQFGSDEGWSAARKELALDRRSALDATPWWLSSGVAEGLYRVYIDHIYRPQPQALAPFFDALFRFGAHLPSALDKARHGRERTWSTQFRMMAFRWPPHRSFDGKRSRGARLDLLRQLAGELGVEKEQIEGDLQKNSGSTPLPRRIRALLHRENFARLLAFESCQKAG